jgi:hypothetical protein
MPMSDVTDVQETLTFVVRLWRAVGAEDHGGWRGRVENVGSQEVGYVVDVAGVVRFIERWTKPAEEGEAYAPMRSVSSQEQQMSAWTAGAD